MLNHSSDKASATIDPQAFRSAMRLVAGSVSLITCGVGSNKSGLVATSMTSLSADPATVLVCVNRSSSSWPLIEKYGHFGVSALSGYHKAIAEKFSGFNGVQGNRRFDGAEWFTLTTGSYLLEDANVALDCKLVEMIDRGSHSIVIGSIVAERTKIPSSALIYWMNEYRRIDAACI